MKKWIIVFVIGLAITLIVFTVINIMTIKNNPISFSNYLKDKNNISSIDIVKTIESNNEIFFLYREDDNKIAMAYFEPSKLFSNRYVYSGNANLTLHFDSYSFGTPQETLIVIYGDNTRIHADRISFTNGDITYTEIISNKDYVLTVYRFDKGNSISAGNITLFDKNGIEIEQID